MEPSQLPPDYVPPHLRLGETDDPTTTPKTITPKEDLAQNMADKQVDVEKISPFLKGFYPDTRKFNTAARFAMANLTPKSTSPSNTRIQAQVPAIEKVPSVPRGGEASVTPKDGQAQGHQGIYTVPKNQSAVPPALTMKNLDLHLAIQNSNPQLTSPSTSGNIPPRLIHESAVRSIANSRMSGMNKTTGVAAKRAPSSMGGGITLNPPSRAPIPKADREYIRNTQFYRPTTVPSPVVGQPLGIPAAAAGAVNPALAPLPARIRTGDAVDWTRSCDQSLNRKFSTPFPCTFATCISGFDSARELKAHKKETHDYCPRCNLDFQTDDEYITHQLESVQHIVCPCCYADFRSSAGRDAHVYQMHPMMQNLNCPGCGVQFSRAGAMIQHIDTNDCHKITAQQFLKARMYEAIFRVHEPSEKGKNRESVQERSIQDGPSASYQTSFPSLGSKPTQNTKSKKVDDTPVVSSWNTGGVPLQTGGEEVDASSACEDGGADRAKTIRGILPAIILGGKQTENVLVEVGMKIDSKSKTFDPEKFRTPFNTYKCPYGGCNKTFPFVNSFKAHLEASTHSGSDHRCVGCLKIFKSPGALMSHMESSSTRCNVKESKYFADSVKVASGGFLGVGGLNIDGTVKFEAKEPEW